MIADVVNGAGYFWRGLPLIWRPRIRVFAFVPLLVTFLLFLALGWAGWTGTGALADEVESWLPDWLDWASWIVWISTAALFFLFWIYGFVLIANLVASPFNGLLAEAVEKRLTGRNPPEMSWAQIVKRLPHMLTQETKKLLYYLLLSIPFLLLSCVVSVVGPLLWIAFSAWMLAIEFGDYPMDNNGLPFREMRRRLARRRWSAFGFGGMTFLAFATPLLNLVAMPAAVAGATIFWLEELSSVPPAAPRN